MGVNKCVCRAHHLRAVPGRLTGHPECKCCKAGPTSSWSSRAVPGARIRFWMVPEMPSRPRNSRPAPWADLPPSSKTPTSGRSTIPRTAFPQPIRAMMRLPEWYPCTEGWQCRRRPCTVAGHVPPNAFRHPIRAMMGLLDAIEKDKNPCTAGLQRERAEAEHSG